VDVAKQIGAWAFALWLAAWVTIALWPTVGGLVIWVGASMLIKKFITSVHDRIRYRNESLPPLYDRDNWDDLRR